VNDARRILLTAGRLAISVFAKPVFSFQFFVFRIFFLEFLKGKGEIGPPNVIG
jgi:hypothetical protein